MTHARTLVVYYSRTGHTDSVAHEIARQMNAEVEAIDAGSFATGAMWYLRAGWASIRARAVSIAPAKYRPQDFDLVILAAPVWVGRPSPPICSYLREHAKDLPSIAFVLTHGGGDATLALNKLESFAGKEPIAYITCSDGERKSGAEAGKIAGFVQALDLAGKATAA